MTTLAAERQLTTTLAVWSGASVLGGKALWLVGHQRREPIITGFGRQSAMWGAIDGAIAAMGIVGRRRRAAFDNDETLDAHRRRLRNVLIANSAADLVYIAGGTALMNRARNGKRTWGMNAGDGAAIVVQGAFLLALDTTFAVRLWSSDQLS